MELNSPGRNTGVGCHSFFQGIFPTQGLNLGLLHCRQVLYQLGPQEALNSEKEAAKGATESPLTPTVMEQFQLISLVLPSSSWALEAQGRFGGGLCWETHFGMKVRITDEMHGQA